MAELPRAALRVLDVLKSHGLDHEVQRMTGSTRTAEEAAAACGCDVAQIIKSLVFRGKETGTPYLLLVSGKNRVHEKRTGRLIGEQLTRPDAHYVREITGFSIGGIPPIGHAQEMMVLMDEDLLAYDTAWGAAGTPDSVVRLNVAALRDAVGARVINVV